MDCLYTLMKSIRSILPVTCAVLFTCSAAFSQTTHPSATQRLNLHHEEKDDPYLPNAFNNKKTSPAYSFRKTAAMRTTGSSIFTTQVNVDANDQNIFGDAGNETNIAVNPLNPNEIVIGWRQFDNVLSNFRQAGWAYSADGGLSWTFPGVIEPGIFRSDPVLDYDADGVFYYNSLTNSPDYFCKVFKSTDAGNSWDAGTDAQGGDKQWMTIDRTNGPGSGNIYSSWTSSFSTCLPGYFTRSTNGGATYENCSVVDGDPFWLTMAVGNAGELFIAGGNIQSDSLVVVKSLNAQLPGSGIIWEPPVLLQPDGFLNGGTTINPVGILGQVNIDIDRSNGAGQGNVYVLAAMTRYSNFDPGDILFMKSTDGGLTFGSPVRINDDVSVNNTQWFGTMSVAPNGRIDVIWLDTRDDLFGLDSSALYYSYSTNEGNTWSVNEKLSDNFDPHTGYPNQDKMGDYFDMISDNTGAHVAWANTLNGEEDVYYSYIIPQITGENEVAGEFSISVYPNPGTGLFNITTGRNNPDVIVYNVLGEKIMHIKTGSSKSVIDLSQQPGGIYFLHAITAKGNMMVKKIVKE